MTVSSPNVTEMKLDRLIDDMRVLRSQMIAFDKQLKGIEASLKPSEQKPESESRPLFAAVARATARTVLILFAVAAATGGVLHYLGTRPPKGLSVWNRRLPQTAWGGLCGRSGSGSAAG